MSFSRAQASANNREVLEALVSEYRLDQWAWFDNFVAPQLVNDGSLAGKIPLLFTEALRKELTSIHRIGEKAHSVNTDKIEYVNYELQPHSLRVEWDSEQAAKFKLGGFDPDRVEMSLIETVAFKLAVERHRALYTLVSTTGNYDSTCVDALTTPWSSDTSDPRTDVRDMRIAVRALRGFTPNCGVINDITLDYLSTHAGILAALSDNALRVPTVENIAKLFGLEQLFVTNAPYDNSQAGGTEDVNRIWGSTMLLFYKPPRMSDNMIDSPQFARTIRNQIQGNYQIAVKAYDQDELPSGAFKRDTTVKDGYYKHVLISQNSSNDSTCAGLITGLYS